MSAPPLACTFWTGRDWLLRLGAALALTVFIGGTYLLAQKVDLRPVHWLTPTPLDRAIPADARAIFIYVTFYPLLWLTGLVTDPVAFRRYAFSLTVTALLSTALFIFFPTGVARGEIDPATAPSLYRAIIAADLPRNALPSEHASLSIIAGLVCWQALRERPRLRLAAWLWIALILWSTLATRQHVLADLVAGALLGALVWRASTFLDPDDQSLRGSGQDNPAGNQRETPETRENLTGRAAPFNTE